MTDEMKEIINSNEKHIAVVARAGCVDKDTEYYNGNTWVKISNYTGDKVLQYEKDGSVSLVEPLKYIKEENDIFYKINNQVLTKEHRVVTDKGIKQLIDLLLENKSINIPVTFKIKNEKIEHSVLDIVCCLLGKYNNDVCTIKTTLNNKFLEELLSNTQYGKFNSNFKSVYTFKHKSKIKTLNLDLLKTIDLDKTFYYLTNIIESKPYITKDRNKGEIFQLIGSSVGFKSILDQQGNTYIVKYENSKFDCIERLYDNVKIIKNQDYKYCFTVPSGMLVLRREGKIFITGNSGKTFTMLNYVKAKPNEKILFLVYNKEMSLDFSNKIKEDKSITNVYVSTIHSIAYRWYIKKYGKRSFKNISVVDIKQIIDKKLDYGDLSLIKFYYNMFLASDVSTVYDLNPVKDSDVRLFKYVDDVFNFYKHNNTIQHNVYLKLFQLSGGKIDGYDTILADECLDGEMFVKTDKGFKRIKHIHRAVQNGEIIRVLSFNEEKEIFEYKEVIGSKETKDRDIYHLKSEGLNSLYCTENHRILTQRGYVRLDEIEIGKDQIILDKINNQKTKVKLNDDQYQLVIGSYLGDGHLLTRSRGEFPTYHIGFTQSEKQVDYMRMKYTCLNISKDRERTITSGYTGKNNIKQSGMSTTFALDNFIDDCLCDMDARALAIWYMDDGNISYTNNTPYAHIDLGDKNDALVNKLVEVLRNNFNLEIGVDYICSKYKDKYSRFNFRKEGSEKLFKIISKYIHKDLYYKIPSNLIPSQQYNWNNKFRNYGSNFVKSIKYCKKGSVYDITVKDNHNFVTSYSYMRNGGKDEPTGIVVHNCNDHNMCMLSILKNNMDKKIIMVGDPLQNLNAFNYTVDGLTYMIDNCGFKKYTLSMSFRISDNIAEIASKFLSYMYDTKIRFYGCKDTIIKKIDLNKANKDTFQVHLLCRNKLGGLNEILELFQKNKNKKIYYVGGLEGFGLNEIENLLNYNGNIYLGGKKFHISELRKLKKDAIENDSIIDTEISKAISLYDFGMKHKEELILLRYNEVTKREDADIIVQTAHSSKGGTFKNVYLAKDFNPIEDIKKELSIFKDNEYMYNVLKSEINLLYVAMTRPTDTLYLNEALNKKDKQKDRFLVDDKIIKKDIDK